MFSYIFSYLAYVCIPPSYFFRFRAARVRHEHEVESGTEPHTPVHGWIPREWEGSEGATAGGKNCG